MHKSGCSLQQIAKVTDHTNYQSLESYLASPDDDDYEHFNDVLFQYHNPPKPSKIAENQPQQKSTKPLQTTPKRLATSTITKPVEAENVDETINSSPPPTQIVSVHNPRSPLVDLNVNMQDFINTNYTAGGLVQHENNSIMQSNVRQAPTIFQGAGFNNCTINFQMPEK